MSETSFQFSDELTAFIKLVLFFGLIILSFMVLRRVNIKSFTKNQRLFRESILGIGLLIGIFFVLDFKYISHQITVALFLLFFVGSVYSLIRNSFYGLFLLIKNQISIGDFIEINGVKGVVHKIQFASTIIYTSDSSYIHIPNGDFFRSVYSKENTKDDHHSAFLQFDLQFNHSDMEYILKLSKDAVLSSIYIDVSEVNEVTVNQDQNNEEYTLIHFKLHVLNTSFNEKIKSDLLIRINQKIEKNRVLDENS